MYSKVLKQFLIRNKVLKEKKDLLKCRSGHKGSSGNDEKGIHESQSEEQFVKQCDVSGHRSKSHERQKIADKSKCSDGADKDSGRVKLHVFQNFIF